MSATERIRAMLDERGVEYRTHGMTDRTWFDVGDISWFVIERENGGIAAVEAVFPTPEQAIEATLGRGEVERLQDENERLRSCLSDSAENAKQIMHEAHVQEAENDKLRELVAGIGHLLFSLNVDYCAACPRDGVNRPCPVHTVCGGECLYKTDLRELGVEV